MCITSMLHAWPPQFVLFDSARMNDDRLSSGMDIIRLAQQLRNMILA